MELSVVIPVYRSANTLFALLERLLKVLTSSGLTFEIVLVDDGSPDGSWQVLTELQATHADRLVVIQLMRNYGQHNALMCGLRHARGEYVVTMDDDLQHPPEEIPKLLRAIRAGDFDLVYGAYDTRKQGGWRDFGSAIAVRFYRMVLRSPVGLTSFRIMRRELVQSVLSYDLNFTFIDGLLAWNTQRIGEVKVEHKPRLQGQSGYNLRKLMVLGLNLFTNFSLVPLQLASLCGFLAAAAGLGLAGVFLVMYFLARITVPGFASIIITILVLGGIQLLALGIIGEYLGRLHLNVNRKPQYVERQLRGQAPEQKLLACTDDEEHHEGQAGVAGQGQGKP
jgi:undecaprenyl-phosphate 4-deoxy-4-formamido-L-arabinose transferase